MFKKLRDKKGMTLIEILIVLGIIAGATAAIVSTVMTQSEKAKSKQAAIDIDRLTADLKVYKDEKGEYPGSDTGLSALVDAGLREDSPQDPWRNDYSYVFPGTHGKKFDICSSGSDEQADTNDDICNWKKDDQK